MVNNNFILQGWAYKYEIHTTKTGKVVCRFGLKFYSGKDKENKSKYSFISVKGFKDFDLKEKQPVLVKGSLSCDEWIDKNGIKKSSFVLLADTVEFFENNSNNVKEDEVPW